MAFFTPAISDPTLEMWLQQGMAQVEQVLAEATHTADPLVAQPASHVWQAGGKRFRPMLTLLAAQFGNPHAAEVIPVAAVVELTHLATLYHDDVMDEAELRRGAPSANVRFGNQVAILTGDFLFARASLLLAGLDPRYGMELVRIQSRTMERLVTGQIRETQGPAADEDPVQHYLAVARDKTAALVAACATMGALVADAPAQVKTQLQQFAEHIGVAFQIVDDVLDVTGQAQQWGKVPGTDLREGVPSLPIICARQWALAPLQPKEDPAVTAQRHRLAELLASDMSDDRIHAETLAALKASPGVAQARQELARWGQAATTAAQNLPSGAAQKALVQLAESVTSRNS